MDRLIALVGLRWRIELRGYAWARERILGLLLVVPFLGLASLAAAAVVFVGLRALDAAHPEALLPVLSAGATAIGVGWALSPLLSGVALTESHDVTRLAQFPIPLPTLVVSSLVANLTQPMVLAELPMLLAATVALAGATPRLLPAALGVGLSFAMVLAVSHLAGLLLHAAARNRRVHDWALFLGLALGFGLGLVPLLVLAGGLGSMAPLIRLVVDSDAFAVSPFAWGVRAAAHAGHGELVPWLALCAAATLALLATLGASAAVIGRLHTGELDLGAGRSSSRAHASMWLPGVVGALVEKDLRVGWRDPALKATLLMSFLGPLLFLALLWEAGPAGGVGSGLLLLASFVGLSSLGSNAFGQERRGLALLLGFPVDRFRLLVAKNVAGLVFRGPGLAVLLLAGFFLAPPALLPAAATIALATVLLASAADNYLSILFPSSAPAAGRNPYGGRAAGGRGLGAVAVTALLMPGVLAVSAPFAFLAWLPLLLEQPKLWLASLPLALAGAAAVYALLTAGAAGLLTRREPDLLERVLGEES